MWTSWSKPLALVILAGGAAIVTGMGAVGSSSPVLFESRESLTRSFAPVFNRVAFFRDGGRDVWMMNQSHVGRDAGAGEWDRLAIVVEGGQARFYQLAPGPLAWPADLAQARLARTACFMCHSNGPRVMRPKPGLPWADGLRLAAWNSRIRGYGRVVSDPVSAHRAEEPPLRQSLAVASCVRCHNERGRGPLERQHAPAIEFMVENGLMPPMGGGLPVVERRALREFLAGF